MHRLSKGENVTNISNMVVEDAREVKVEYGLVIEAI